MKAQFVFEKFEEESDPIEDMGISMKRKFDEFLESHGIAHAHKPFESAIAYAANQGEYDIVRYILDNGIHPDLNKGFAMKQAIESGDLKMIELLWEYGADMKVYGHKFLEWTALRGNWSNDRDNYKLFKYFLEKGAVPSPTFFSAHTDTLNIIFYQLIKKYTKMNLLGESVNEKFSDESDPVQDLGIGIDGILKKYDWLVLSKYLGGMTIKDRAMVRKGMNIKGDHTMYLGEQNSNKNKSAFAKVYLRRIERILEKSTIVFEETYTEYLADERKDVTTKLTVYDTPIGKIGSFTYVDQFPGLVQYFGDPDAFLYLKPFNILGQH